MLPASGLPGGAAPVIAFESGQSGDFEIWTVRLDGTDLRQLTHAKGEDTVPAWSPDGRSIVFVSYRTTWPKLWSMNADGNRLRQLTRGYSKEGTPVWTRDGRIVYPSRPDPPRPNAHTWFIMRGDGTHKRALAPGFGSPPSFSPDGRRAVFSAPCPSGYSTCVYGSNASGGDRRPLTTEQMGTSEQPVWSPDGKLIAFIGNSELSVMNADGSEPRQLAPGPLPDTYDDYPSWSPDGSRVVFGTNRSPTGIAVINRDGSGLAPVGVGKIRQASRPAWQRHG
jgi:Tol biopolymer transport system component